jgi:hypothetical protein
MRDFAAEMPQETTAARATPETERVGPTPEAFVAGALLSTFRTRTVSRLALATQIFLTLATGIGLVAAVWALTTA